jgi:hypothetical protein
MCCTAPTRCLRSLLLHVSRSSAIALRTRTQISNESIAKNNEIGRANGNVDHVSSCSKLAADIQIALSVRAPSLRSRCELPYPFIHGRQPGYFPAALTSRPGHDGIGFCRQSESREAYQSWPETQQMAREVVAMIRGGHSHTSRAEPTFNMYVVPLSVCM